MLSVFYAKCLMSMYIFMFAWANQDDTTMRANTLSDDEDDIQRQLDNEAMERLRMGRKHFVGNEYQYHSFDWNYRDYVEWGKTYPDCNGNCQSPIDIPINGLVKTRISRCLMFTNYETIPDTLNVYNDGMKITFYGDWSGNNWPMVSGGPVFSRRYHFHSVSLHWYSEHVVGGVQYPVEAQALHVAADYGSLEQALASAHRDPQALLVVSTLYRLENTTHPGLKDILAEAIATGISHKTAVRKIRPLSYYVPPLSEYAAYQGSLTEPPCTQGVMWIIRGKTFPVQKDAVEAAQRIVSANGPMRYNFRPPQPKNERKIFHFR